MLFGNLRERLQIEGIMPERALLRLKRAGIPLYNLQKPHENRILFRVKRKDIQKVFAIYPNMCYNKDSYHPYILTKKGGVGAAKWLDFCKNRVGFCLGILLFAGVTLFSDGLVFGVEIVGDTVYRREVEKTLKEGGVTPFTPYPKGKEDILTATLLALPDVEFCSVQKIGHWVRVEIRRAPFRGKPLVKESMTAARTGVIEQMSVLKGTPLKGVGESVEVGELLVGNWWDKEDGERVTVEPMARVKIACTYEGLFVGSNAEEGFARAYLELGLEEGCEITQRSVTERDEGVWVQITYTVTQSVNF